MQTLTNWIAFVTNPSSSEVSIPSALDDSFFIEGPISNGVTQCIATHKLLLIYIHCPFHFQTESFCGETLFHPEWKAFLQENFVCWRASVSSPIGFQVLQKFSGATRFPFVAVVKPKLAHDQSFTTLDLIEGYTTADDFRRRLQDVLDRTFINHHNSSGGSNDNSASASSTADEQLAREQLERDREIRRDQELAYAASLQADFEQSQAEMREFEARLAEAERQENEQRQLQRKLLDVWTVPSTVDLERQVDDDTFEIAFRTPSGRFRGRFAANDPIGCLYAFVATKGSENAEAWIQSFELLSDYPRKRLAELSQTIGECFPKDRQILLTVSECDDAPWK